MTIKEYMTKVNAAEATGEYTGRDMVLGLDCTEEGNAATPADYTYVGVHVEDYGAALSPQSEDKSYVYEGDATLKTSTQRTFQITGQAYLSDEFMDFIRSHAVKFGTGSAVQRGYCYFHSGTKEGECGTMTILVNNDGNGAASSPADIDVELKSSGPVSEYTYTAAAPVNAPAQTSAKSGS